MQGKKYFLKLLDYFYNQLLFTSWTRYVHNNLENSRQANVEKNVFTVLPLILILSRRLFIQLIAQLDCSRKMLKRTLKFTLKCSYMFRFNNRHQGAYCCALLKL